MKTNHWKRTIAGLLAMSTLFSLSFTAVSAEETTAETPLLLQPQPPLQPRLLKFRKQICQPCRLQKKKLLPLK